MFDHAVGCGYDREFGGITKVIAHTLPLVRPPDRYGGVLGLVGIQSILRRRFHGLIMLGEWSIWAPRPKDLAKSMLSHDKGVPSLARGHGRPSAVRNIVKGQPPVR